MITADEGGGSLQTKAAVATRLRGIWLGVTDVRRSRSFYERLGARFEPGDAPDGIVYATLGDTRLVFEAGAGNASGS